MHQCVGLWVKRLSTANTFIKYRVFRLQSPYLLVITWPPLYLLKLFKNASVKHRELKRATCMAANIMLPLEICCFLRTYNSSGFVLFRTNAGLFQAFWAFISICSTLLNLFLLAVEIVLTVEQLATFCSKTIIIWNLRRNDCDPCTSHASWVINTKILSSNLLRRGFTQDRDNLAETCRSTKGSWKLSVA